MSPLEFSLLPDTATIGADGQLVIGGCDTLELARRFGTPLYVYDETHLRARCREAVAAFGPGVNFATKSFLCVAMARLAAEEGCNLDVSTAGEYHVARAAGVAADRLVLHGNNKSSEELRRAIAEGVGRIIVDSFDELDRIEALVAEGLPVARVLIRVTPGVEAHTHEFVRTGQDDSKFGFGLASGLAEAAVTRAAASPAIDLLGIHAHIGSQVFESRFFEMAVEVLAPFLQRFDLPEFSVGGGLGVAYVNGERAPSITEWAGAVHRACAAAGITARVTAEPGRSLVAQAAVTLYEVGTIKDIPDIRTYVSVDGGMSDNLRPMLYGSRYEAFLPREVAADRPRVISLVGKHCESGDLLIRDALVPADLRVGDILATPVTGAYGHSLSSNYNKVPRPAVVFVADGEARLVVRRETLDDLLSLDLG
ncbi:MAG: diaminopimelate decarboxylase [Acidobacteria bacterium]|nr:diaminopimelate decarboxylase [Acidobacteriota bacterium]